jgi:hypothetical protein
MGRRIIPSVDLVAVARAATGCASFAPRSAGRDPFGGTSHHPPSAIKSTPPMARRERTAFAIHVAARHLCTFVRKLERGGIGLAIGVKIEEGAWNFEA